VLIKQARRRSANWLMLFYERVGAQGDQGANLCNDDILAVVGVLLELRNGRGESMNIVTWVIVS
jgi:DNA-directed RNA polymerase subunit beta